MKLRPLAVLLFLPSVSFSQGSPEVHFSGTAINTTNPDSPVAAPIRIVLANGTCKLTVSRPLAGSGGCTIKNYDKAAGKLELISLGPPTITWSGTVKGNLASGAYRIDARAQAGYFYLAILQQAASVPPPPSPIPLVPPAQHRSSCTPAVESSILGDVNGWSGETIFKLDNGQIWQQAEYDYTYFYEYHPDVTIYETSAGCRMKVEDEDETLLVKRIK